MKISRALAAIAALGLAGSTFAGVVHMRIDMSGAFTGSFGDLGGPSTTPLGTELVTFSAGGGHDSVTGNVISNNAANINFLSLTLTNFVLQTTSTAPITLNIRVRVDFDVSATDKRGGLAQHQFDGNIKDQVDSFSVNKTATHDGTTIPVIFSNAADGDGKFNAGSGDDTAVHVFGNIYSIDTTYTFTLARTAEGTFATLNMPTSGVDTVTLVPLPAATYAGIGTLALCGLGGVVRRRRFARA